MRVLVLSTGMFTNMYGQQKYEWDFLSSLRRIDSAMTLRFILLNDYAKDLPFDRRSSGMDFTFCGNPLRIISKIKLVFAAWRHIFMGQPDIVICSHINLAVVCWLICRLSRKKYMLLTHGWDVWHLKSPLKLRALNDASRIVTVSRFTAGKIMGQTGRKEEDIFLIPPSVDMDTFAPGRPTEFLLQRHNLRGNKIILTVCRLSCEDRDKGYDRIILSLPQVLKVFPKVRYVLVGSGTDVPRIKKLVHDAGLDGYVVLPGFVAHEELASYYNLCDVFVMPSKIEGFGIVFVEALACGKPVVAGNKDGACDALLGGRLGLLVDPDNQLQISDAIIKSLKGDVNACLKDGNFLRQSVVEHFNVERFRERVKVVAAYLKKEACLFPGT